MLFRMIKKTRKNFIRRATTVLDISIKTLEFTKNIISEPLEQKNKAETEVPGMVSNFEANPQASDDYSEAATEEESSAAEVKRKKLQHNFEQPAPDDSFIQSKQQSMKASQGVADHSGSSYHGPGKPGDKSNANMWQRNFDNHQGN